MLQQIESRQRTGSLRDEEPGLDLETAMERIGAIDLRMVKLKLMDAEEGQGWSSEFADHVELRYRRYLCMVGLRPDRSIVPTKDIDTFWHQHILDTRAYAADCDRTFGAFFHHFPYFGMRGEADAQNLLSSFEQTQELYAELFGEPYCPGDGTPGAGRCVKCGTGPVKCHHPPTPTRCK